MTQVERRDQKPEPSEEPQERKVKLSRRDFLVGAGSLVVGGVVGGVVGTQLVPPEAVVEEPEAEADAEAPAADAEAESPYKAGHTLVFDPYQCTGCMMCAVACAEKYSAELHPEETANTVNLEFARIRPMRFQYVDVVNVCSYCTLEEWAEGSSEFPCAEVCPEDAIITVAEGEGKEGYYAMGYKGSTRISAWVLISAGAVQRSARTNLPAASLLTQLPRKPRYAAAAAVTRNVSRSAPSRRLCSGSQPAATDATLPTSRPRMRNCCTARCITQGGLYNGRLIWNDRKNFTS
jgi:ferredoxin